MMLRFTRWFFSAITPKKEIASDPQVLEELIELRRLVDSLCAHTQTEHENGTPDRTAQLRLEHKARMHGFRLIQKEMARARLADLEGQKKELLEDFPHLRSQA